MVPIVSRYRSDVNKFNLDLIFPNTIQIIQDFLNDNEKKTAFIKLLKFRFDYNMSDVDFGYNFLNFYCSSYRRDFYNPVILKFIELLEKNNCTAEEVLYFIFIKYLFYNRLIGYNIRYDAAPSQHTINVRCFSKFFYLLTIMFDCLNLYEYSRNQEFILDLFEYYDDAEEDITCRLYYTTYIQDVFIFDKIYKNIPKIKDLTQYNKFVNKEIKQSTIDVLICKSEKEKLSIIKNSLCHDDYDESQSKYFRPKIFNIIVENAYGKNSPSIAFLKLLQSDSTCEFETMYLQNFIPVVGTWLEEDMMLKLFQLNSTQKQFTKIIKISSNKTIEYLIKCGFVFNNIPNPNDMVCKYQLPPGWKISQRTIIDSNMQTRAKISCHVISEQNKNSRISGLDYYWLTVTFLPRFSFSFSTLGSDYSFQILDRQSLECVARGPVVTCRTNYSEMQNKCFNKFYQLFPLYKQIRDEPNWYLYWGENLDIQYNQSVE
jgi:hypothetical protein